MSDFINLETGPIHWFADWPIRDVPRTGAIVYTIWDKEGRFIYVGMAGRSGVSSGGAGPFGRLASHASGRRSGDQFCIYVCDRFVLSRIHNQMTEIVSGSVSLDKLTRDLIRADFGFRFMPVENGSEALAVERQIQRGALEAGKPILNPLPQQRERG